MANAVNRMILLVEDDDRQRKLYRDMLTRHGHTVYAVSGAEEALTMLYSNVPSLVLLDIMMPVMNGIELCREIRKLIGDKLPIVFLTASSELSTIKAALEAGGDDFLVKGSTNAEVIRRLDPWLKASSQHKTAQHRRNVLAALAGMAG